mmetsp:Transcript_82331/g.265453  ORF Transcript_82331/g.265453 Transcript_82331/m.265453 type:complete len:479 (+) Transcript_82331:3202-4638(+)
MKERRVHSHQAVVGGLVLEVCGPLSHDVALPAQVHLRRHYQCLAVRIDGGVCHLGESLSEVVVEHVRLLGKHRQRLVVAHAKRRLLAHRSHGLDDHLRVLDGVAHVELERDQVLLDRLRNDIAMFRTEELCCLQVLAEGSVPLPVRFFRRHLRLDGVVLDELASLQVDHHHLARAQAALRPEGLWRSTFRLQDARLRTDDAGAVVELEVARRAEPVAIQGCAHVLAITEREQGRAVPGLLQGTPIVVELFHGVLVRVDVSIALVGFRDHDHQGLWHLPVATQHELSVAVQVPRVAVLGPARRQHLLHAVAEVRVLEGARPGMRPIVVPLDGVDLAVVADGSERLRQGPTRHGVCGETAVPQGVLDGIARVLQVLVVGRQSHRLEHALVHDGLGGERADVERVVREFGLRLLAGDVERTLELRARVRRVADEDLLGPWLSLLRVLAQHGGIHGNDPVSQDLETFMEQGLLEDALCLDAR